MFPYVLILRQLRRRCLGLVAPQARLRGARTGSELVRRRRATLELLHDPDEAFVLLVPAPVRIVQSRKSGQAGVVIRRERRRVRPRAVPLERDH
jgi:hypothetical protein